MVLMHSLPPPPNLGIYAKITHFELILADVWSLSSGGHFGFTCYIMANIIVCVFNAFPAPQNIRIDTQIIKFELIGTDL